MIDVNSNILLIYTGGTIGMVENKRTGALEPFNFDHLYSNFPEIKQLNFNKRIIKSIFGLDISFFNVVEFDHVG